MRRPSEALLEFVNVVMRGTGQAQSSSMKSGTTASPGTKAWRPSPKGMQAGEKGDAHLKSSNGQPAAMARGGLG